MTVSFSNLTGLESSKSKYTFSLGPLTAVIARVTLDSSYPSGGYGSALGLAPSAFGLKTIFGVQVMAARTTLAKTFDYVWDAVNGKLVVRNMGQGLPAVIVEEVVTMTSNAGRLAHPPAYIFTAEAVAGSTTGSLRIIPTGKTPATKQMAVTLTTGALATLSTDAVTSVRVSYIPLGVGPFIEANRVVDEAVVWGSGAGDTFDLASRAALIQYIWNDTSSVHLPPIQPVGEAPATNEITIDINNTAVTTITNNNAQDTNLGLATYWKFTSMLAGSYGWTDDADTTITSTTLFSIADDIAVPPQGIWIPGFGNVLVGEATATNKQAVIEGPNGTAGANIALYDPVKGLVAFTGSDAYTTLAVPYMFVNANQVSPNSGEVPAGTLLTTVTLDIMVIGRPS